MAAVQPRDLRLPFARKRRRYAVGVDHRRGAGHLYDDVVQRHLIVEGLARIELDILADLPGLDRAAADKLDDTRNNAGMWKVHLLDTLMGLGQHLALLQIDDREIRRQPRQHIGIETA